MWERAYKARLQDIAIGETSRCLGHHARENAEDFVTPFNRVGPQINVEFLSLQFEEEPLNT